MQLGQNSTDHPTHSSTKYFCQPLDSFSLIISITLNISNQPLTVNQIHLCWCSKDCWNSYSKNPLPHPKHGWNCHPSFQQRHLNRCVAFLPSPPLPSHATRLPLSAPVLLSSRQSNACYSHAPGISGGTAENVRKSMGKMLSQSVTG